MIEIYEEDNILNIENRTFFDRVSLYVIYSIFLVLLIIYEDDLVEYMGINGIYITIAKYIYYSLMIIFPLFSISLSYNLIISKVDIKLQYNYFKGIKLKIHQDSFDISSLTAVKKAKKSGLFYINPTLIIDGEEYAFANFKYSFKDYSKLAKEIADYAGVPLIETE